MRNLKPRNCTQYFSKKFTEIPTLQILYSLATIFDAKNQASLCQDTHIDIPFYEK